MTAHFPVLVNINFTAEMEEKLDLVEEKHTDWVDMLKDFYQPFKHSVDEAEHKIEEMKGILDEETSEVCERCGRGMVKKLGKYGFFLACSGFPECRNAKPLPLGKCPATGCEGDVVKRQSKKGRPFYACTRYPDCTFLTREAPADKPCPRCGKLLFSRKLKGRGQMLTCLTESCGYRVELLDDVNSAAENTENGNGVERGAE
jgi:DNA topoisomerase-1